MPHNKSETINKQQNHGTILEEATTVKAEKGKNRPPSLNQINKNNET